MQPVNETTFGKFTFELITPLKIFILKAESSEEKGKWMKAIGDQVTAIVDKKAFRRVNEEIRSAEEERAEKDTEMIEKCADFENLMSLKESRCE